MLAEVALTNTEIPVYTVPSGKSAMVYVEVNPISTEPTCVIKVNELVYWTGTLYGFLSAKMALTGGDVVKVGTNGRVNVFVHGILA